MRYKLIYTILFISFIFIHDAQSKSETADYKKLVGTWVRPDGGYVLVIKNVRDDGNIDAAYFNPGTIRVSEARVSTKADRLNIYVELRDTGYPGSNYTLTYDPDTDRLVCPIWSRRACNTSRTWLSSTLDKTSSATAGFTQRKSTGAISQREL